LKIKKIISVLLIALFVLQLLPIKQVINYFLIDNITVEEIVHTAKTPSKPPTFIDEDQLMTDFHFIDHSSLFGRNVLSSLYKDMLTSCNADDVETPPPNAATA
jgi:hypothetical protein